MDEYISREAVVRYLKGYSEKERNSNSPYGMITSSVLDKAERALSEMPAADVQPVKHGRWKYYENNGIIDTYICTNCQGKVEMAIDVDSSSFKYCPNCGARMDGDAE